MKLALKGERERGKEEERTRHRVTDKFEILMFYFLFHQSFLLAVDFTI
jgi:hypothetical protein